MTKEKNSILLILFLIVLEILLLINSDILIYSVKEATTLFMSKLFVTLFPFFVLNQILIEYNFQYYISKLSKNFIANLFKISSVSISLIFLSLLTGHPSNAKYIKDFLDKKIIKEDEATKLLIITYFPNPVFVITTVGFILFGNILIGVILLILIYIINFILAIFIRNKIVIDDINANIEINRNIRLSNVLKNSFINSFNTLMIILGNIIIFTVIINLFNNYFNFSPLINSILSATIELTTGINKISTLNTDFNLKFALSLFSLIISGISIHSQVMSILSDYKINFKQIFKYRIITSIISFIIIFLILVLCF